MVTPPPPQDRDIVSISVRFIIDGFPKRVMEIINGFEPSPDNIKQEKISKEGLIRYLMSDDNAPVLLDRFCD